MGLKFVAKMTDKALKPVIGITLDYEKEGSFAHYPYYALRTQYFEAIERAGGLPIALPYSEALQEDYLNLVDGVLIPGGSMAKPLHWYEDGTTELPYAEIPRSKSDIWYAEQCMARKIPFLGICEGMQVLAGVLGCVLTAKVQESYGTDLPHVSRPSNERAKGHDIKIKDRTLLSSILKVETLNTNTLHREAVRKGSDKVVVSATAVDGVIEAIEAHPEMGHPFALGVEWHPEFFITPDAADFNIFTAFVRACKG